MPRCRCGLHYALPLVPPQTAGDRVSTCEALLGQNLRVREAEITAALAGLGASASAAADAVPSGERSDELRAASSELAEAERAEAAATARTAELEAEAARLAEAVTAARAGLDAAREEAAGLSAAIAKEALVGERILEKRRLALRRRDECEAKLREIGSLPGAEVEQWQGARKRDVLARLAEVNESLKAFGTVNTKAIELHSEAAARPCIPRLPPPPRTPPLPPLCPRARAEKFKEQRASFVEKVAELDRGDDSLRDLM